MVSIIIINFRQKDFLDKCVRSIYSYFKSFPFEVIIINNSPEEKLSFDKDQFPGLMVYENQNKGFSQANNTGAKYAKGEYLLFLNADTEVCSDFLSDLVNSFKEKDFGAAGLKLYNTDNTFQLSFWNENTFFNEIRNKEEENKFKSRNSVYMNEKEKEYMEIKKVDWVTGASLFIRKDIFESTGGFDEDYFLFYEDADLCKRISDKGLGIYFYPRSRIIHHKGENVNPDFQSDTYYYSKQSQLIYYKKHNNLFNNILLRLYLLSKFSVIYLLTFKKIYLRIVKLTAGVK